MVIPSSLFKYHSFSTQSLAALKSRKVFFAHPRKFNDPFDCKYQFVDVESIDGVMNAFRNSPELKHQCFAQEWDRIKNDSVNRLQYLQDLRARAEKELASQYGSLGVCCLGKDSCNLLMWGHYADGHRGFCLEFNTEYWPFNKAHHVEYGAYGDDYPTVDLNLYFSKGFEEIFQRALLSKSKVWGYEEEWRVIHKACNRAVGYEVDSLRAIYFGAKMDRVHEELGPSGFSVGTGLIRRSGSRWRF